MSDKIEVGEAENPYRLWAVQEAQRQAETIIAAQAEELIAAEGRASGLLGWLVGGTLAAWAVIGNRHVGYVEISLVAAPVIVAMGACILALWPLEWHRAAIDPAWLLLEEPGDTEAKTLRDIVGTLTNSIKENQKRLDAAALKIRLAWVMFLIIPFAVTASILFVR